MAQGDIPNAKDDIRYYGEGVTLAALATDLSHQATNLTVGATFLSQSGAQARWDVPAPFAYEFRVEMNNADTGCLYAYVAAGNGVIVDVLAGGVIQAQVDGVVQLSVTAPGVDGVDREFIIGWSGELNPSTTGASDAVRSELRVWNRASGAFAQDVSVHAQPTSVNARAVWLASDILGTNTFTGAADRLRFGAQRFHPAAETREDLDVNGAALSLDLEERLEVPVPRTVSGAGDDGRFIGPVCGAAAAALGQADLRQAGHLWEERYRVQTDWSEPYSTVRSDPDPDGDGFTFLGPYQLYCRLPVTINRLKVRVHVQAFRGAGDPDNIVIRAYTMNRPPVVEANGQAPIPAWLKNFASVTVNSADGSGTTGGAWYTFPLLTVQRTEDDLGTWVALAFDVQDAGGAGPTTDQEWRIRAWVGEPGLEVVDGGLPLA